MTLDERRALEVRIAELEFDLKSAQEKLNPNELAHASTAPECCHSWSAACDRLREELNEVRNRERALTRYVDEAAGPESVLIPISTLTAIGQRAEKAEVERDECKKHWDEFVEYNWNPLLWELEKLARIGGGNDWKEIVNSIKLRIEELNRES